MKKILTLALIAVITLASCGKSDDSPTPNNIENQELKKIKEVQIAFLQENYNPNYNYEEYELPYTYTLMNRTISYEYDTEGRISKVITKDEGKKEVVHQVTYEAGKIVVTSSDGGKIEYPLSDKGFLSSSNVPYFYDEKGQLSIAEERFYWENGNLSQIIEKKEKGDKTNVTKLTYYPNENKNKFFIFNIEGNAVNAYMLYLGFQKLLPIGVPTKNLVKTLKTTYEHKGYFVGTTTLTTSFDYTYDADGYVTSIKENRKGDEGIGSSGGSYDELLLQKLEQLMRDIDNGTIKNKTYKVHQNDNGVYHIDVTHLYHITKDTNGKDIDLKYEILKSYKFTYTEANGVRKYNSYDEVELKNRDASTTYKITYQ